MNEKFITSMTLCWDCKRATGGCSWSARLKPVKGWTAKETKKDSPFSSYIVEDCPLFERDAIRGGAARYKKDDINV